MTGGYLELSYSCLKHNPVSCASLEQRKDIFD